MVLDPGKMYRPTDVAFDNATNNSVFVVEQFNHRVSKWDYGASNYTFVLDTGWGSNNDGTSGEGAPIGDGGALDNAFYRPTGIAFDDVNDRLYVTDTFHNRVRVLNSNDGTFISSFGVAGSAADEFYHPAGIAINSTSSSPDTLFVIADELNHRVVQYDVNGGTPITPEVLDDPSDTTGLSFVRPHGVVYDQAEDEFNVTDSLRGLISSYTEAGAFVNQYGTPGSTSNNVNLFYPGSGAGVLFGTTNTAFADTRNNAIKTMNNETIALTTADGSTPNAGTVGTGDGQLYWPESVAAFTDAISYVLAANTYNNRVEAFSSAAAVLTFQSNFGSPGSP